MKTIISKLNKEQAVLIIILLLGFFLRIQGVITNSFPFTYDVGRDMLMLDQIASGQKIPLIGPTTGLPGLFYGPWWYYMLVPAFFLSNGNPQGIVIFMALTGVLTAYVGYRLGKRIDGVFLGLVIAFLTAISPAMISISSQIWNPHLAPLFLIVLLFLTHVIYTESSLKNPVYFYLLGILLSLSLDMEVVYGVLLISSFSLFLLIFFIRKLRMINILSLIAGFVTVLLPRIAFDLRHNFLMTKAVIAFIQNPSTPAYRLSLVQKIGDRIQIFYNLWRDTVTGQLHLFGIGLLLISVFVLIYYRSKASGKENLCIHYILLTLMFYFVGLTLFSQDIWGHYVVGLPLLFIVIISIVINLLRKATQNTAAVITLLLVLGFINLRPLDFIRTLRQPLWEGDASVYRNQLSVVDYIYKEANGKKFNYTTYTPPIYDYTYQYLFKWYGNKSYDYSPTDEREDLLFIILEPDTQYTFRRDAWLKVREGDGKVIKEKVIKGGIVVQTRNR